MSDKASPTELTEVLAFLVFAGTAPGQQSVDKAMEEWRNEENVRLEHRTTAANLLSALEAAGVNVAVRKTRDLREFLDRLITIPAKAAYELK